MPDFEDVRVLIVEDDALLAETIAIRLRMDRFMPLIAPTGADGLRLLREQAPALVLLDLALPDQDGIELCRKMRAEFSAPIIIVSGEERDCMQGLAIGADDHLASPVSLNELAARVQAALRRAQPDPPTQPPEKPEDAASGAAADSLILGNTRLDMASCRVEVRGRVYSLTPNEFRLLGLLMRNPGQVFSPEELLHLVWRKTHKDTHVVEVHIGNLRRKIEEDPRRPKLLVNVRFRGYKFQHP